MVEVPLMVLMMLKSAMRSVEGWATLFIIREDYSIVQYSDRSFEIFSVIR